MGFCSSSAVAYSHRVVMTVAAVVEACLTAAAGDGVLCFLTGLLLRPEL